MCRMGNSAKRIYLNLREGRLMLLNAIHSNYDIAFLAFYKITMGHGSYQKSIKYLI